MDSEFRDDVVVVVKSDCPTCQLIVPVLRELADSVKHLTVYSQDDVSFLDSVPAEIDRELDVSWALGVRTVPTLIRFESGVEVARTEGWSQPDWVEITGVPELGRELPVHRPGCGSKTLEPQTREMLLNRSADAVFASRIIPVGELEDDAESMYDRGWTDGLPVVPPTPRRVLDMLEGTDRDRSEVVAAVPPLLADCTVEKVAANAVMAGCRPEYLPVVLAALEAVCAPEFNMHGVLATTHSVGPVIVVNGPLRHTLGMNSGVNVLGQGNRANATIGRAVQLIVRNVGGGRPGEVDRATLGHPGKFSFCFAEDEEGSPWTSLAEERGFTNKQSVVTVFAGEGPRVVLDQKSRDPESLTRSLAEALKTVGHSKAASRWDALLVIAPDQADVYRSAGWDKEQVYKALDKALLMRTSDVLEGAGGIAEGLSARDGVRGFDSKELLEQEFVPKFRQGALTIIHAGSRAGLFAAIIGGWMSGNTQSVSREIRS